MSYIFPAIQLTAALIGTWKLGKLELARERYLVILLWFTFFIEFGKLFLLDIFNIEVPWWWYESYIVISYLFYFYWYHSVLERKIFKQMCIVFAVALVALKISAYSFPVEFANKGYAFITGAVSLLVLTVLHFYQLLRSNEVLIIRYKLSFWVSTALLLFYMGIIPLILLSKYINVKGLSETIILVSLNCILYGCYIIGFLWMKKKYSRF